MACGRVPPHDGMLPVYSVDTIERAEQLIAACCKLDFEGKYYAPELAHDQTIENLQKFSNKLQRVDSMLKKEQ